MVELMRAISNAVIEEQTRAAIRYGNVNASSHESYAIIKEELDEAADDLTALSESMSKFWSSIKNNSVVEQISSTIDAEKNATQAAAELVQVAAMCRKARKTIMEAKK